MWDIYIYFGQLFLAVALWTVKYRHLQPGLKVLGFSLLSTSLVEGYAAYLVLQRTNNFHMYHFLVPAQYAFYALVFYKELKRSGERNLALASIPAYLLASCLIILLLQETSVVNTYARLLRNLLLIGWSLLYYREVFQGLDIVRLDKEPMFWVSTGLFFYSLGNFFVEGLMNHLLDEHYEMASTLFYISVFLGLLLNFTFIVAFLLSKRDAGDAG